MIQYSGGDGSSIEQAIIILGAESELEGVDAEYEFMQSLHTEFELDSQTFLDEGNKKYDLLTIKLPDETKKDIWFDISDFMGGKMLKFIFTLATLLDSKSKIKKYYSPDIDISDLFD